MSFTSEHVRAVVSKHKIMISISVNDVTKTVIDKVFGSTLVGTVNPIVHFTFTCMVAYTMTLVGTLLTLTKLLI